MRGRVDVAHVDGERHQGPRPTGAVRHPPRDDVTFGGFPRQSAAHVDRLHIAARRLVREQDHAVEAAGGENRRGQLVSWQIGDLVI